MSTMLVVLLAIAAVACGLIVLTLLALLRVAAHSDAQIDRENAQEPSRTTTGVDEQVAGRRPTGRFARRRDGARESDPSPLR